MENNNIHIHFDQDEQWILIHENELIMDALIEHGIFIKKACSNGACGICLTPLIEGEIDYTNRTPRGLSTQEKEQGFFLPCIAHCKTSIKIGTPKVK